MKDHKTTPLHYTILLILGSYVFGYNFHNIIHELGHSVTVSLQGGKATGYFFHPFEACLNFSTSVPNHILLYAGGAFIGGAATILFLILAWRFRTPFMMPFIITCTAGLTLSARWMLTAPISKTFTDYSSMIELGFPTALILLAGLIYLILGAGAFILYLPLAGVTHESSFIRRVLIFTLGFLPYHMAACVYMGFSKGSQPAVLLLGLTVRALILAFGAACSRWLPARSAFFRRIKPVKVRPFHIFAIWIGAALLVLAVLLIPLAPEGLQSTRSFSIPER